MTDTDNAQSLNDAREAFAIDKGRERAEERREKQAKQGDLSVTNAGQIMADENVVGVTKQVIAYMEKHQDSSTNHWPIAYTHLRHLEYDTIALIALRVCLDSVGANWSLNNTTIQLANTANSNILTAMLKRNREGRQMLKAIAKRVDEKGGGSQKAKRDYALWLASRTITEGHIPDPDPKKAYGWSEWDLNTQGKVGAQMLNFVLTGCDLFELELVKDFYEDKHPRNVLVFTEHAKAELDKKNNFLDGLSPRFGPMFNVPWAWDADSLGPYDDVSLAKQVPIVKNMGKEQEEAVQKALEEGTMDRAVEALNILQEVPYSVNGFIVEAVAYARDKVLADDGDTEVTSFPNLVTLPTVKRLSPEALAKKTSGEKADFNRKMISTAKSNREVDANKMQVKRMIEEAELILNEEHGVDCFYLPHQFDFRGRIYHTSEFGHHNADYIRAMFNFANKTEITQENIKYLMLQIANTFGQGVDKMSLNRRMAWVRLNSRKIAAVGANYKDESITWDKIDFEKWGCKPVVNEETGEVIQETPFTYWATADDPFQFLAACRELHNAMKAAEEGEPYFSGLPVALDATQSGVQMYAAMGRNREDGEKVNLTKNEKPGDLYTAVVNTAKEMIDDIIEELEAEKTLDEKQERDLLNARQWKAFGLKRKHLKRPTMTASYSAEAYGFADQIRKDLMDKITKRLALIKARTGEEQEHPFGEDNGFSASWFMGQLAEDAIKKTVKSAAEGMEFIQHWANVCSGCNMHLHYTTPTGFPMMQNYRKRSTAKRPDISLWDTKKKKYVDTKLSLQPYGTQIDGAKAERACSPNFIHSIDATLLQMAVLQCKEWGVSDMMVIHDSFSTTIANAKAMSDGIHEAFVQLFDQNCPYSQLKEQTVARIAESKDVPKRRDLDIQETRQSDYLVS